MLNSKEEGDVDIDQGKLFYQKLGSGTSVIVLCGGSGFDEEVFTQYIVRKLFLPVLKSG